MLQLEEFALALGSFILAAIALFIKSIHWDGIRLWPRTTSILRVMFMLGSCGFLALTYQLVIIRKGNKPWSNLHIHTPVQVKGGKPPAQQPPVNKELPIAPPVPTPKQSKPKATKPPHKALGTQPQEPTAPKVTPNPISPRLGTGPDAYKDISDEQVGQWAIEGADKIEQMAKQHINAFLSGPQKAIFFKAQVGFFSNDFKACCAQDVKDLRGEILRRLGPPAKDVKEEQALKRVFREMDLPPGVPIPPQFSDVDPFGVKEYAPYLRRLGTKLKQRNVPKLGPLPLHFSEARRDAEIPEFPYEIVVTIETTRELVSGYILVKFNGFHNRALCDLEGSRFISESDEINEIGNDELSTLLAKENQVLLRILKIGKIPFLPSKPMHVTAYAKQTFHVSSVTFFDE